MKTSNTYCATMDDIIFEQRNMSYGAYMIRKRYIRRVYTSLAITIIVFALVVAIPEVLKFYNGPGKIIKPLVKVDGGIILPPPPDVILNVEQPKIKPPKVPKTLVASATLAFNITDKLDEDTIKIAKNVNAQANPSPGDIPGDEDGPDIGQTNGSPGGTGSNNGSTTGVQKSDSVVLFADEMPAFPGLARFLQKNLRYPAQAVERGIEGYVYLSFVVSKDGSLRDINLVKGISKECDEEALRVARKMPDWKPGKYRGQPVSVRYNLPIKYVLNN